MIRYPWMNYLQIVINNSNQIIVVNAANRNSVGVLNLLFSLLFIDDKTMKDAT